MILIASSTIAAALFVVQTYHMINMLHFLTKFSRKFVSVLALRSYVPAGSAAGTRKT